MQPIDFWKLSTQYSIRHAALLIVGKDPEDFNNVFEHDIGKHAKGYVAVRTAICSAILGETLATTILAREQTEYGETNSLDIDRTIISVYDLDAYVKARGMVCEIFDRTGLATEPTGTASNPFFSAKLDAANKAWAAVTRDRERLAGKSPKQALERWLTEHAPELGLLNKDGKPNQTGIEEIAKVANWKPLGGATPTPSTRPAPEQRPLIRLPSMRVETYSADLDDEIPF